jgi:hypothetical protein
MTHRDRTYRAVPLAPLSRRPRIRIGDQDAADDGDPKHTSSSLSRMRRPVTRRRDGTFWRVGQCKIKSTDIADVRPMIR